MEITDPTSVKNALRLSYAAEVGAIGIWDYDATQNSLHWNSVMHRLFDHPEKQFTAKYHDFTDRLHPEDKERVLNSINKGVPGKTPYDVDYRIIWRDGTIHHIRARAEIYFNENNEMTRLTGICYDISQQVNYEKQLEAIALQDALTGIYNRQYLVTFEQQLKETPYPYTLLFIDLNSFKKINDSLGHTIGDRLLRLIAIKISRKLRKDDADILRLGGDEYLIILHGLHSDTVVDTICSRVLPIINNRYQLQQTTVRISASIGVASSPQDGDRLEDVIRAADIAMYHNKLEQQNSYEHFNPLLKKNSDRQLHIEEQLYLAIEQNQMMLHYQPVIHTASNTLYAIESLARWHHPTLGKIPPKEFITIAESNGFIRTIDQWVVDNALSDYHLLTKQTPATFKLAINVSIISLHDHAIYRLLKKRLNDYQIEPNNLILEVTETSYTKHFSQAFQTLTLLKHLGINIALDDFGVEYSSLKYLQKLPVNYLKVDQQFIANISGDTSHAIIECLITLSNKLNIQVIAEGVENSHQYSILKTMGCQLAQGKYFSTAISLNMLMQQLPQLIDLHADK